MEVWEEVSIYEILLSVLKKTVIVIAMSACTLLNKSNLKDMGQI